LSTERAMGSKECRKARMTPGNGRSKTYFSAGRGDRLSTAPDPQ
jgi:hypothetical protein